MKHPAWKTCLTVACALFASVGLSTAQVLPQPKVGDPIHGLTPTQLDAFLEGRDQFNRTFTVSEGLGPIFNQDSCGACHNTPAIGGAGTTLVTRFGFADKGVPFDPLEDLGGSLLQAEAIDDACQETVPPGATIQINRVTPLSVGLGLIEGIPDADLLALESLGMGMAHMVPLLEDPGGPLRVGRFGWKAQVATALSFSGDAALNEMGITNPLVMTENAPNGDAGLLAMCDTVPEPEEGAAFIDALTAFQRYSAPPPQTPKSGMSGEQVFIDIGCADCHIATPFVTGPAPEAALSGVSFKPYSDFLLHDMGSLGDGIVQGDAGETQMRTPPLWGVRDRPNLLHDGRVDAGDLESRIDAAVGFHGGEGVASRLAYEALEAGPKAQLIAFLDSLGRVEFDVNLDLGVTAIDFENFLACFTGPGSFYTADDPCAIHDIDQDGDVDLDDFDSFLLVYLDPLDDCDGSGEIDLRELLTGAVADCNGNLIPDSCDIADGTEADVNGNGVPDSCETFVRGDCNVDGAVDLSDVIRLLDYSFSGAASPDCDLACDANADDSLDIGDAIFSLNFQFVGGAAPAAPFPDCGMQSPLGTLGCASFTACP